MINALVAVASATLGGNILRAADTVTLSTVLADMGTIFTKIFEWVPTVFTAVTSNPLLFLLVAGSFSLIAVGVVQRLLSLR